jgi:G3E family GTPase
MTTERASVHPVPLVVLGGYLGAGKTTLINHLLRHAQGQRIAVLVNDFGDVNIDADLIVGASSEVLALSGGCVCCSFGDDLLGSLRRVAQRQPAPDVIVLECSGVGMPGAVAQSAALCPNVALDGIAVVADASRIQALAEDRYVGETVRQQLHSADLLLVNQQDLCAPHELAAVHTWLQAMLPRVPTVSCEHGRVPPELLLGGLRSNPSHPAAAPNWLGQGTNRLQPLQRATTLFCAYQHRCSAVSSPQALADLLRQQDPHLLRAKGLVQDAQAQLWQLHIMGQRVKIDPAPCHLADNAVLGVVLCIGLRERG